MPTPKRLKVVTEHGGRPAWAVEAISTVNPAGLYRCCVESAAITEGREGVLLECPASHDLMVFHNNRWQTTQGKKGRK